MPVLRTPAPRRRQPRLALRTNATRVHNGRVHHGGAFTLRSLRHSTANQPCSPRWAGRSTPGALLRVLSTRRRSGHVLTRHNTRRRVRRTGPGVGVGAGVRLGSGAALDAWCVASPRRSDQGGQRRASPVTPQRRFRASNQPPCAGPPHRSRLLVPSLCNSTGRRRSEAAALSSRQRHK